MAGHQVIDAVRDRLPEREGRAGHDRHAVPQVVEERLARARILWVQLHLQLVPLRALHVLVALGAPHPPRHRGDRGIGHQRLLCEPAELVALGERRAGEGDHAHVQRALSQLRQERAPGQGQPVQTQDREQRRAEHHLYRALHRRVERGRERARRFRAREAPHSCFQEDGFSLLGRGGGSHGGLALRRPEQGGGDPLSLSLGRRAAASRWHSSRKVAAGELWSWL